VPKVSAAHLESRRRQILAAALECFSRQGFHRTTMQEIVLRSNLSPGAIYRYFASKEEIVQAIADERHAHEREVLAAAQGAPDPAEGLRRVATAFLGALDDPEERARRRVGVQIWAEALRSPRIRRLVRRGIDGPRAALGELIRRGQASGTIALPVDPDAAARAMIALFHGFVLQQAWEPNLAVHPYLAVVEAAIDRLLAQPASRSLRRRSRAAKARA
jgi:AcrR family transcriptional regulator